MLSNTITFTVQANLPTITGSALVGHVLSADTSEIADADGLTNATFTYQWLADGTPIDGATASWHVINYTLEGQTISVAVSYTDDAGNDETATSAATETVTTAPLTVGAENVPDSHNGGEFTFYVRFSEELFALSYAKLRNDAFEVSGGQIARAQRADRASITRNVLWRITVTPDDDGDADVTVTLPAATDCTDAGAVCTQDGRRLTNTITFTVRGPA